MCLFCKIVAKQIPAKVVLEDEHLLAFHDINPMAPTHVLVIPKEHLESIGAAASPEHEALLGKLLLATKKVAEAVGIADTGFRVVVNRGRDGGQSVDHLHLHVLGGRGLSWPPG